jgi:intein/homing endonuclease
MKKLGKPDKLDKYRSHLVDGAALKPDELEMLAKYRKAHSLLCLGFGRNQVLATLEKEFELSQPQLYAIVRESVQLYGSIEEVDKKGQRVISHENYKLLANLARKNGDIGAAIRAQENADKLLGLFEAEKTIIDPKAFLIPMPMSFSTDPAVLREQETEDIDFEEVNDVE